jgi:hypothetical protein
MRSPPLPPPPTPPQPRHRQAEAIRPGVQTRQRVNPCHAGLGMPDWEWRIGNAGLGMAASLTATPRAAAGASLVELQPERAVACPRAFPLRYSMTRTRRI